MGALVEAAEEESLFRLLLGLHVLIVSGPELRSTAHDLDIGTTIGALALPPTASSKLIALRTAVIGVLK